MRLTTVFVSMVCVFVCLCVSCVQEGYESQEAEDRAGGCWGVRRSGGRPAAVVEGLLQGGKGRGEG